MIEYASLIIDIENSRGYGTAERNDVQKFMIECVDYLNKSFEKSLEFDVTFSAGDEIQGLFRDITSAVLYMRMFEMMIRPVKMRAGIGVGEWNVIIKNGLSTQQDGPVYHRARQAIEEVKKRQTQRYRIISNKNDELVNNLVNASCVLKEQQGYMQNIAQIIMELLYPFEKESLIIYDYDMVKELLEIKFQYKIGINAFYSVKKQVSDQYGEPEDLNKYALKIMEPVYIDGINFDSEDIIIKKNMSSNIAAVLGCKRQNADMLIKRGHVIAIRNMDYIALQYIEREYKLYDI